VQRSLWCMGTSPKQRSAAVCARLLRQDTSEPLPVLN
jgi:hypothetical protein